MVVRKGGIAPDGGGFDVMGRKSWEDESRVFSPDKRNRAHGGDYAALDTGITIQCVASAPGVKVSKCLELRGFKPGDL